MLVILIIGLTAGPAVSFVGVGDGVDDEVDDDRRQDRQHRGNDHFLARGAGRRASISTRFA